MERSAGPPEFRPKGLAATSVRGYQGCDTFSGGVGEFGQDRGVGVGGEILGGVLEHLLNDLEVGAGSTGTQ